MSRIPWLDLETTGLSPKDDVIIEAAMIVTDGNLLPQDAISLTLWDEGIAKRVAEIRRLAEEGDESAAWVVNMHTSTGLLSEAESNGIPRVEAVQTLIEFVKDNQAVSLPLAGSSVHFDRGMMRADEDFVKLDTQFHYRIIDLSSFTSALLLIAPERADKFWQEFVPPAATTHRALDDIKVTIETFRALLQKSFGGILP
jgi:oligoribonuclease